MSFNLFAPSSSSYISDCLFHFVGWRTPYNDEANFATTIAILRSKTISHRPHESGPGKISYTVYQGNRLEAGDFLVPMVTCFADIPAKSLDVHMSKYGKFGLGFSRKFLILNGARPVMYVPMFELDTPSLSGRSLLRNWQAIAAGANESRAAASNELPSRKWGTKPIGESSALAALIRSYERDLLAFTKPFDSELPVEHRDNFYLEREWRRYGSLSFELSDLTQVFVQERFVERIAEAFPVLKSVVISVP